MIKGFIKIEKDEFNLDHTFSSGQIFRWKKYSSYWIGVCYGSIVALKYEGNLLNYKIEGNIDETKLKEFLGLDHNYEEIKNAICEDPLVNDLYHKYKGLRVLKQNKRECLVSYLSVSFNNIKRANQMLEKLSKFSKRKLKLGDFLIYDYPNFAELKKINEKQLRKIGYGFRSSYIISFSKKFENDEELEELSKMPTIDLEKSLMKIKGVGIKTASCVSLYSYSRFESIPIDTWITKILVLFYKDYFNYISLEKLKKNYYKIRDVLNEIFKNYGGYAQLFLYKFARDSFKYLL
ncbi:MAG: DNA glycosylase [Thermoproteota archaeon]|jgi:N-glycosylase/DNA lyase|nr:DNA glycosylase [Thermoproteota archaeon]